MICCQPVPENLAFSESVDLSMLIKTRRPGKKSFFFSKTRRGHNGRPCSPVDPVVRPVTMRVQRCYSNRQCISSPLSLWRLKLRHKTAASYNSRVVHHPPLPEAEASMPG
ncbi:hypothetical protein U9M48_006464 [Paspalum notatum var. saurae]|uniref:Uncharacterized protein n=1 Tax=Paspalum notatum var. saurae TaxID=547442 RepID=A0AAQ3PXX4_PASNO